MVKFNVQDEPGFLASLEYLGEIAEDEVLAALDQIQKDRLGWDDFVSLHGWARVELAPENTYPGADPLFWFAVKGHSGALYQIAAKGPYQTIVVCSVAAVVG